MPATSVGWRRSDRPRVVLVAVAALIVLALVALAESTRQAVASFDASPSGCGSRRAVSA